VGSRSKIKKEIAKEIERAYIAGFLDGDGSLMLQIKKRHDSKSKFRFMSTICFYQDTRHAKDLTWIREIFEIGYISKRNDGMSELRINGYQSVKNILEILLPFIRFKRIQAEALFKACIILSSKKYKLLLKSDLAMLVDLILIIQKENYATKSKKTRKELLKILGLTP